MNLRFIMRDGEKILQQSQATGALLRKAYLAWIDVPLIEEPKIIEESKKPRQFFLCRYDNRLGWHVDHIGTLTQDCAEKILVREVLQ